MRRRHKLSFCQEPAADLRFKAYLRDIHERDWAARLASVIFEVGDIRCHRSGRRSTMNGDPPGWNRPHHKVLRSPAGLRHPARKDAPHGRVGPTSRHSARLLPEGGCLWFSYVKRLARHKFY
jgi:hypothetical protein